MVDSDACAGHECDHCPTCQRGRCCRGDDPDYHLPAVGSWPDPIYGAVGMLREDGERIECHICGGWYVALGVHAWRAHNVTGDEYRAFFGLGRSHGLSGADLQARQRNIALTEGATENLRPLTEEQRAKGAETVRRSPRPEHIAQAQAAINKGRRRQVERMATDPTYNAEIRQRLSRAKGGDKAATATCPICGRLYWPGVPSRPRLTCTNQACVKRWTALRTITLPPELYRALTIHAPEQPIEDTVITGLWTWLDSTK